MEEYFQYNKNKEDIKKSEGIGDIENKNENNKINITDTNKFTNPNIINNNRNYNNSIKENNSNQDKFSQNNSMNLNYPNAFLNNYRIPSQPPRIIESQNFYHNRIRNFNTSNRPLFSPNQSFDPNLMLVPNYNYVPFNYLNPSQNIIPNCFPQFDNFNPYDIIDELNKRVIELEKNQNQLLDYRKIFSNEEQDDAAKYKRRIYLTYEANLRNANAALKNNQKIVFGSNENVGKEKIIIYMTTTETDIAFIEKLNKNKAVEFKDLEIPEITYKMIEQKIENAKYKKTEKDNIILKECENKSNQIYYNEYMFYSKNKISLFTPHIIRTTKNLMSLFFSEKLNLSDFQYNDSYKKINNDVFLQLLSLRINEFNKYEIKNGIITDKKYNEKKFGFYKNISGSNYYLYSTMEKDIISKKLTNINIQKLFEDLTGRESQSDVIDVTKKTKTYDPYETFNRNMNLLKGLSYEELILYIILNKIDKDEYEIFPKILFYEYYLTLNGEKVVVSNKIEPGYSEADLVLYSKCDVSYEDEPILLQKTYINDYSIFSNGTFKIEKETLYFIELKSSFNFSEEKDKEKRISKYKNFFKKLFNKYKEFIHLYESKKWIEKDTKKEILLIYDNDIINISIDIESILFELLRENQNCIFKIIYTLKSYPYFSYSLAIDKHKQIEEQYANLKKESKEREEESKRREEELAKKIEELIKESKKREEESKKREEESKRREEELAKKIEKILQENKEIKESLINNNKNNSEVSNLGKNNNETKKDEN